MFRIRTLTVAALAVTLLLPSTSLAGLGSDKTMYLGGTVTGVKEKTEGKSSTTDETVYTSRGTCNISGSIRTSPRSSR